MEFDLSAYKNKAPESTICKWKQHGKNEVFFGGVIKYNPNDLNSHVLLSVGNKKSTFKLLTEAVTLEELNKAPQNYVSLVYFSPKSGYYILKYPSLEEDIVYIQRLPKKSWIAGVNFHHNYKLVKLKTADKDGPIEPFLGNKLEEIKSTTVVENKVIFNSEFMVDNNKLYYLNTIIGHIVKDNLKISSMLWKNYLPTEVIETWKISTY